MDLAACSLEMTLATLHSIVFFSTEVSVNMLVWSLARYSSSLLYGRVALVFCSRAVAGEENISNGNVSLDMVVYRHSKASGMVLYGIILELIMLLLELCGKLLTECVSSSWCIEQSFV